MMTLDQLQTYSGSTRVTGNILQLMNNGQLQYTSSIEIDSAELRLNDNDMTSVANRVPSGDNITMRGGAFYVSNAANLVSSYNLGQVTVAEGENAFTTVVNTGGGSLITIANLIHSNSQATVNFVVTNDAGRGQVQLTQLNGSSTIPLTNSIIGGWAIVGDRMATYVPGIGVTGLTYNNAPSQSAVNLSVAGPTDNVDCTGSVDPLTTRTINSLRFTGDGNIINMASAADRLTIGTGGFTQNGAGGAGQHVTGGQLSAGAPQALPRPCTSTTSPVSASTARSSITAPRPGSDR